MYELLAKYPIKDLNWFVPATSSFTRDSKGRLLAFPWMAEVPVMFYNTAAYKKAGLDPNKPARTWTALQAELLKLRDVADIDCPYASSEQVTVHLENLAPINNQLFTSNNNGLDAVTKKSAAPGHAVRHASHMRHISLMVSWKRSLLFVAHSGDNASDKLFAKGECAVLTSNTGAFGQFLNTKSLSFGVAPLPYYDQVTKDGGKAVSPERPWPGAQPSLGRGKGHRPVPGLAVQARHRRRMAPAHRLPAADGSRLPRFDACSYDRSPACPGADRLHAHAAGHQQPRLPHGQLRAHRARAEPAAQRSLRRQPLVAALNNAASQARSIAAQR